MGSNEVQVGRVAALEAELQATRDMLDRVEAVARSLQRERDSLRDEAERLQAALLRRQGGRRVRLAVGGLMLAAFAGGVWFLTGGRLLQPRDPPAQSADAPLYRSGIVHESNVALRKTPDTAAPSLAVLAEGTHVVVRRTLWHNLEQWVEVEVDGQTGYVLSTEVNLS
jgi:hypothetical protein